MVYDATPTRRTGCTSQNSTEPPLAGHAATKPPTVSAKEAAVLVEMTKMCVRLERRLALQEIDAVPGADGSAKSAPYSGFASRRKPQATQVKAKTPSSIRK